MIELKPCPFCGSSAELCLAMLQCGACGAHGPLVTPSAPVSVKTDSWNRRISPWRSLNDYTAPTDPDTMLLLRRTSRMAWMLCGPLGRKRTIELAMADGFDEYMEVPE